MAEEDSSLQILTAPNGQLLLRGMDEYQLASSIGRAVRVSRITPDVGAPIITYYETITTACKVDYTHKSRNIKSDVRIVFSLEPLSSGSGFEFENEASKKISQKSSAAIEQSIKGALVDGVVSGRPVIDIRVKLVEISYQIEDYKAFSDAARAAIKDGLIRGASVLLEPIMQVEVVTDKHYANDIAQDFKSKRGRMKSQSKRDDSEVICAIVPLANLFGYSNILKHLAQGLATYTMQFDHFSPVSQPGDPPRRPAVIMRS